MSDQLAAAGIPVMVGFDADNLAWRPDCVVVGNVCSSKHPEVLAAEARDIPRESFPSMVARALLPTRHSLVVAGTHGKTTTSSLCAWLLEACHLKPSYLIGGVPLNLGRGAALREGGPIVLEGDEYDSAFFDKGSKFLHYQPKRAILTSVEYDHVDIFPEFEVMRETFRKFVRTISEDLIVNHENAEAMGVAAEASCNVLTYRVQPEGGDPAAADYTAVLQGGVKRTRFEVFEHGESLGVFTTQLAGAYNVGNVLSAIVMARREGADLEALRSAVARFRGVRKRQEVLGIAAGVRVIEDFAHHPTAVQLTVTALRKRYAGKALHVCFEPRSSSSRRAEFSQGYVRSFDAASAVYIAPVHRPDKVSDAQRLDTEDLATQVQGRGISARAYTDIDSLREAVLERAVPGDTVVLLSSGDFSGLGSELLFGFGDPVTFARAEDMPAVASLLEGYGQPRIVPDTDVETLVLRSPGTVDGCVSLSLRGESAYLFGLAVAPQRRGQGLGWVLGDIVLRRARTLGAKRCYLLTNTATDFFAGKLGFSEVPLGEVDPQVRKGENFAVSAALPGAVCMVLPLQSRGSASA
jgi:UDP-N-acetylmuramate: L-alanyl-gamma-D-glutamyl-meso-diaminopimelate ligase